MNYFAVLITLLGWLFSILVGFAVIMAVSASVVAHIRKIIGNKL